MDHGVKPHNTVPIERKIATFGCATDRFKNRTIIEAHRDVYEKEIDAFSTVFTHVSMKKIGTSAIQSRATGGVANGTYMFALPGSPGACKDAWDEILVKQLDIRHKPCNFVEIMPRLDEHLRRK